MAEVTQQLTFLPVGTQQDQAVAELLVEIPGLRIDRQSPFRLIQVDVAPHQVVTSRQQQVRIRLVVDQRNRLVEQIHGGRRITRVQKRGGAPDERASEGVSLPKLPVNFS